MKWYQKLANWLTSTPNGLRVIGGLYLIFGFLWVAYRLTVDNWKDIKRSYKDAWTALKEGKA